MLELAAAIRKADHIAVIAHVRPDGDAAGSVIGLSLALEQLGKQVTPVLKDGVPPAFAFLEGAAKVATTLPEQADLCIVVDAPDALRTGYVDQVRAYGAAGKLGLIDHHKRGDLIKQAVGAHYRQDASSTSELIVELITELAVKLTPPISTALLTGMYTDTGGFQYGNTTTQVLDVAAELMRRGGKLNKVVQHVARQRTMAGLKLLGVALSRLTLTPDTRGSVTVLSLQDLHDCEATAEDAGGLVSSLNVLPEVDYCLLITELEPGIIRGTLRASDRSSLDVARMALAFGGGGHPKAAGFSLSGHLLHTEDGWRIEPNLIV